MLSDRAFADICAGSYDSAYKWDARVEAGDVYAIVKRIDNLDVVCFRGSVTIDDWVRDLRAVPDIIPDPKLGVVHASFFAGMLTASIRINSVLRKEAQLAVTGHSLGAARAWLYTGIMLSMKVPARVVVFGSPRPAFPKLASLIAESRVPSTSYRNATFSGHDRVTDLPFSFPELPWTQPVPLTDVDVPPVAGDNSPFRFHHIQLYQQGVPE